MTCLGGGGRGEGGGEGVFLFHHYTHDTVHTSGAIHGKVPTMDIFVVWRWNLEDPKSHSCSNKHIVTVRL